ncbi:MAG: ATP-dependent DNA helicase RecG [Hyphomonadaceae bacterium]|nr:ATP-dependent DNA helicase RecG [Hyphomonadaceae bacterium]
MPAPLSVRLMRSMREADAPPPGPEFEPLLEAAPTPRGMRKDVADLIAHVAGGHLARDVLFIAPTGAIDRRNRVPIAETVEGEIATIEAEVDAHLPSFNARAPYRIRLRDASGFLSAAYFRPKAEMLKRLWPVGQTRLVSGRVQVHGGERQMLHPDYVVDPAKGEAPPDVEPVYPLTAGLAGRQIQRFVREALSRLGAHPEWLDPATVAARRWPSFADAIRLLHQPVAPEDILPSGPARTRLAYDEFFVRQAALHRRRARRESIPGQALSALGDLEARILASLPFAPTDAQRRAAGEIGADLARAAPMLRMLQGDVGSGKTLVAALAMARAAEAGVQSALMAPTEILARQHGETMIPLLGSAGVEAVVLTGRDKLRERRTILAQLASGQIKVVLGTHALFQDDVSFADLGLVVIDEQHRFGVSDRMRLVSKGAEPHVLVMSATPIPRTLALAMHGDMDISILDEKPPGRKPVATRALSTSRMDEVIDAIARAAMEGDRAYWVCPVIEDSELTDLAAVEDRYELLRGRFGDKVALVHGRLPGAEREKAMERFRIGDAFVLVATTVIEVGVNVPEATIMVIEHAERFGLAQLHQLRGRVGRGERPATCLLLWRPPLSDGARERLDALRRTDDGFAIAELDYKMRGAGDILGVRQSGFPAFRFVAPELHGDLLPVADREARLALQRDPDLETPRGRAISAALRLFGVEDAAGKARSG